jgi:hypothetical protein
VQSRRMSMIEVATNIAIGLVVSFISQIAIFKLYDIHISVTQNIEITIWFTVISIIRSYLIRRWFNSMKGNK